MKKIVLMALILASCESPEVSTDKVALVEGGRVAKIIKFHFRESGIYPKNISDIDFSKDPGNGFDVKAWGYLVREDKKGFTLISKKVINGKILAIQDDESFLLLDVDQ